MNVRLEDPGAGILHALVCAETGGCPAVEEALYAVDCRACAAGYFLAGRPQWKPAAGPDGGPALEVAVSLLPPVWPGQYKGLRAEYTLPPADPEAARRQLEALRRRQAVQAETDQAAAPGDLVEVDYDAALEDGLRFSGSLCRGGRFVLGGGGQPAELSRCLQGLCPGQKFACTAVLPADYPDRRAAGKTAHYAGTLRRVFRQTLPPADDAFARTQGFETLAALQERLAARQRQSDEDAARRAAGQRVLAQITARAQLELPPLAVEAETDWQLRQLNARLEKSRIPLQQHLKRLRKTEQQLQDDLRRYAAGDLRSRLVLLAVARAEGLAPTGEELAQAARVAVQHGIRRPDRMQLRQKLCAQKASDFILAQTVFVPVPAPQEGNAP